MRWGKPLPWLQRLTFLDGSNIVAMSSHSNENCCKESAEKSGKYGDRAKEVAARTVMKQHKEKGHKKGH
jgi:hypothetical protein